MIARYIVIVDRFLTDDCDGTGLYHDGTGLDAARQLARELQQAWDEGGVAGHFKVVGRTLVDDTDWMNVQPSSFENDPPTLQPRYAVQTLMAGNDTMFSDIEVTLFAVVDQISDPETTQIIQSVWTSFEEARNAASMLNVLRHS